MNRERLEDLCLVLEKVIIETAEIYNSAETTKNQKALLETIIGAAIWYLPGSGELYSGKISKLAEEKVKEGMLITKLTKEHRFPRKQAGKELLSTTYKSLRIKGNQLSNLYMDKYGKFNLVLKNENKDLVQFQKDGSFVDDETAYRSAKIELIERSLEQLKDLKPGNKNAKSIKKGKPGRTVPKQVTDQVLELLPQLLNQDDSLGYNFTGIKLNGNTILRDGNPNRCYIGFLEHIITHYGEYIPHSELLSSFIRPDRNDPVFAKDLKYNLIKSSGASFFSSHAGNQVKKRRIINMANELGLQIDFLY